MNKDITEITELSVIESSVSMQNGMKNSGDVARHNRERTKKIHSDNKKSAKQQQEKRIAKIRQFRDRCLEYKYGTVKDGDRIIEYKTGTKCGNIVGDRIRYILRQQKITVTDFSDQCGVGRNSLQRYLSESDPDIPTVKTLEKIINALPCSLDDFIIFADDYERWQDGISNAYALELQEKYFDYEAFKNEMMESFYKTMVYEDNGKKYRMPLNVADVFIKQMLTVFETVNVLLEYEKKMVKPKVFYNLPVIEKKETEVKIVEDRIIEIETEILKAMKKKNKEQTKKKTTKQQDE